MDQEKFLLVTGNPSDGFSYFGPFDDHDGAIAWADLELRHEEWWIAPITVPLGAFGNGLADGHSVSDQDVWGEDSEFLRSDWQYEVAIGDTNLSYWGWVSHQEETKRFEREGTP